MRLALFACVIILALPGALAFQSLTGSIAGTPARVHTLEKPLYFEFSNGHFEVLVTLEKDITSPITGMRASGYGQGNFTIWIEPATGGPRHLLLESKTVQHNSTPLLTGFAVLITGMIPVQAQPPAGVPSGNAGQAKGPPQTPPGLAKKQSSTGKGEKGIARRRLEALLTFLQGPYKGLARYQERQRRLSEAGVLLAPMKFRHTCTATCAFPTPMMHETYRLIADVDGKVELQGIQYTVIQP